MANLVEWIEEAAAGKPIIGVVIGEMGWGDYGKNGVVTYDRQPRGKVLSWDEARPFLDYDFDDGYGAPACNAIYVWTDESVIGISQYDGSTSPFCIPRNPVACMPDMPGPSTRRNTERGSQTTRPPKKPPADLSGDAAMSTGTPFNVSTATPEQMIERAEYLEAFPARGRYRDDLLAEASALREAAIHRHVDQLEAAQ